jgi:ribosomal protein S27AE
MQLPETWAEKMTCPICGSRPLGVFHPSNHADRFACGSCETSFELEDAGKRVRFVTLPQGMTPWMRGQWVLLDEALAAFELARTGFSITLGDGSSGSPESTEKPAAAPAPAVSTQAAVPTPSAVTPPPAPAPAGNPQAAVPSSSTVTPPPTPTPAAAIPASPIEEPVALESIKSELPVVEEKPVPRKRELHDPFPELSVSPEELNTGPYLLFVTDRTEKKPGGTSPFYDEDFSDEVVVPDARPAEIPAPEPEPEKDAWKDSELERVKKALVNPPATDFAGSLTSPKPWEPSESEKDLANHLPARASESVPTIPIDNSPANKPEINPVEIAKPVEVDYSSLDYLPPTRPLEDTPPAIIQPPKPPPVTAESTYGDDMDSLRTHITGSATASAFNAVLEDRMADALERAKELQRLGNTDPEVRSVLQRSSGLTPEQVSEVLKKLEKPEEKRRSNRILIFFLIGAIILFALLALWFMNRQKSELTEPAKTQQTFSLAGKIVDPKTLPEPIQTLLPNGIQILNEDPSVVQSDENTIPSASCPASKGEASALFGGPASDWSIDNNSGGWILLTKTQGVEVRIPANMTGGYLIFEKGPEMRGVTGPAIVKNIYMISVSCK